MIDDNRGLALGIAVLFLSLIGGAILIWIMQMVSSPVLNYAANATASTEANAATGWFRTLVEFMPGIFLLLALFGTVVYALFTRVRG